MILVKNDQIAYKNKQFFEKKFDEALVWFFKIKDDEEIILPPKVSGKEICLFDLYKLIIGYGGHEIITVEGKWNKIAMTFGFPECYGEAFNKLFIDYMLHPHEYFIFAQKWFGKVPSIENQKFGRLTDKIQDKSESPISHSVGTSDGGLSRGNGQEDRNTTIDHSVGTSDGGLTRGNGQEDRNVVMAPVQPRSCKESDVEEIEDENPSIEGYYSEGSKDPSDGSDGKEDFVMLL